MPRHVPDLSEQRRYRNYIIDSLEVSGSFNEQLQLQQRIPTVPGSVEVLLHWSDVYHPDAPDYYTPPTFSSDELAALAAFQAVWEDVCAELPGRLPPPETIQQDRHWMRLRTAARQALAVFEIRGRSRES
jgi:hypothetical protein